jgi:chromosome segregation ATPase
MYVSIKLQELQKKKEELKSKLQTLEKKEKTLGENLKILEEEVAIQELEEKVETKGKALDQIKSKIKVLKRRLEEPQTKQAPSPMPQMRARAKPVEEESLTRAKGYSKCGGYLGYLASFPENEPIPKECLVCPKVLDCVMMRAQTHQE